MTQEPPRPSAATDQPARDRWGRQIIGPFTRRHIVVLLGALVGVGVLLTVLTTPLSAPAPTLAPQPGSSFVVVGDVTEGLAIGQQAPELTGMRDGSPVSLLDLDGNPVSLADLRGGPVWVNFWASWCPPCQEELPVLRAMDEAYRERGYSAFAEYAFLPELALGVSSNITHASADVATRKAIFRQAHGVFARVVPVKPLVLLAEANAIVRSPKGDNASVDAVGMVQADVEPWRGIHFVGAAELLTDSRAESTLYGGWLGGWVFLFAHMDARLDLIQRGGNGSQTAVLFQLHGWL